MHPAEHATRTPDKAAIIMAADASTISFADLDAASNASAWQLRSLGLRRGDVAAALFTNGPEVFVFGWAAQRSGLYQTSISHKLSARDVAYVLKDCGAAILLASPACAGVAEAALAEGDAVPAFLWRGSSGSLVDWSTAAAAQPRTPIPDESAGADLLYSSGTTGRPKGIVSSLPEGSIEAETPLMRMGAGLYGMGPDTIYLSTSPLYHAAPLRWAMAVQQLGGTVVVMERFDAEETLRLIERHRITHATFVPTHFVRMLKLPWAVRARYDVSSLRAVVHAAAPCPVPIKQKIIDWFGPIVHEYYSGTENCGMTALSSDEWLRKPGSVGRAVIGTVHILDDSGVELPPGRTGCVFFADGPAFGYLNDPAKTAAAHDARGWATLGDIGHVDEEGYLFLSDRRDFMVISGGVNVYPQEIENLLVTHPAVADVAVIGVPDDEMGEVVLAIVQPAAGVDPSAALADELRAFARRELGGVKTPRRIDFLDQLPREPTGKLFKRELRDRYLGAPPDDGGDARAMTTPAP